MSNTSSDELAKKVKAFCEKKADEDHEEALRKLVENHQRGPLYNETVVSHSQTVITIPQVSQLPSSKIPQQTKQNFLVFFASSPPYDHHNH